MAKKLKKIRHPTSNKSPKTQFKPIVQPEITNTKKVSKKTNKRKRKEPKPKKKAYNAKNFNTYAFPDKPVVDCGIINKRNYIVVKIENPKKKNEIYYSKTLFKTGKNGEIKQFFIIQILQDKVTKNFTTYNRKGVFPNYGKGWRFDVFSFNDALLDWYDTINKCKDEGYEEKTLEELTRETSKEREKIIDDDDIIEEKKETTKTQKEIVNKNNESIKKTEEKEKKKQFEIKKKTEKEEKKIINEKTNIINNSNPINTNNNNNKIPINNNQTNFTYKKIFKCDKKESPKKFFSHSLPRFNVIKDEGMNKPSPIPVNIKSTDILKLKVNFSGEAQQKQVTNNTNENLMISNPSNPAESRDENNENINMEEENNTMMEESDNNNIFGKMDTKMNIEKNEKEKNEDISKGVMKLLKMIFDTKEAKKFLTFIGIDINSLSMNQFTNDLFIKALNKLNEIEKTISSSKSSKFKSKKLFDLTKEYNRLIPHIYHIYNINSFLIDTNFKVQKEIVDLDLIKSVSELDNQAKNFNNPKHKNFDSSLSRKQNKEKQELLFYKKLLDSIQYNIIALEDSNEEYKYMKEYLNLYYKESKNENHPKLSLKRIYRLYKKDHNNYIRTKSRDNTILLWYGCQIAQVYSILKNGFELPAREAPDNSYVYGKGIMLSQNAFEQAQKCATRNGTALLLGCSVDIQNADEVNDVTNFELFLKNKRNCSIIRLSRHCYKSISEEERKMAGFFTYYNYMVYDLSVINISYIAMYKSPKFPMKGK